MRKRSAAKRIIGVTGGVGTGKTTVARMFGKAGARVIDADRIARTLLRRGSPGYRRVIAAFGRKIVKKDGSLDRRRLGRMVFRDKRLRNRLNAILHPGIIRSIKEKTARSRERLVVIDAPLLYEAGLKQAVDAVAVVTLSRREQIRRCEKKTGLSRGEILSRIAAQLPLREKLRSADFIIDNNGTLEQTREQVDSIRRNLWRS